MVSASKEREIEKKDLTNYKDITLLLIVHYVIGPRRLYWSLMTLSTEASAVFLPGMQQPNSVLP